MLLGNYTVLNKTPGRYRSGLTVSDTRAQWSGSGSNRACFTGSAGWDAKAARPNGYLHPYAWVMPRTSGGLASYTLIVGLGALVGSLAGGRNAVADLTGAGSLSGDGSLIASAVAALAGSGTISDAGVLAELQMVAALNGSGDVAGALLALGNVVAALSGEGSLASTVRATGTLASDITLTTGSTLTAGQVAQEVWSTVAASYNTAGSFGASLNFTEIVLRNKTVTDPTAGTITVYDTDGTTILYVADLFQDAAGAVPYAGAGAERRERLT